MGEKLDRLYDGRDMLVEELIECFAHGSIGSTNELQKIDTLAHATKNLDKIIMAEEFTGGGYSRSDGYSYHDYPDRERYVYRDEPSYSGRQHRDSRGRYSRDEGKADAAERIERMMRETNDPHERDVLRQALEQLRGR